MFMNEFFLFILGFILSFGGTYIVRCFTLKHKIIDVPNERSSHDLPTPRGGGIAIVITWFLLISFLFLRELIPSNLFFALLSGLILAVVSFIDDLVNLKPWIRLFFQLLTVIIALFFLNGLQNIEIFGININALILYPLCIIGMVWFINLYNFLDGIDGYASIEAIVVALIMFFFTSNLLLLIISSATLGFLVWNWPRAKIFMGDVGSTQLGFILVILGIYFQNNDLFSIWYWLMITAVFWFDATLTLYRRWRNKEKLSQAHRKHIYQRIVQSGFSHLKTDIYLIIINIIIFSFVYISFINEYMLLPMFAITIIFLYSISRIVDSRLPFK